MNQTEEFKNQTVLITGASAGIGAAAAHAFGSRGAHVIVHYNSRREAAEQVVAGITAAGGSGETVQADLAAQAGVRSLVDWVKGRQVDVLVNNAGSLVRRTRVLEFTPELMDQVMTAEFHQRLFRGAGGAARDGGTQARDDRQRLFGGGAHGRRHRRAGVRGGKGGDVGDDEEYGAGVRTVGNPREHRVARHDRHRLPSPVFHRADAE